MKFTKFLTGVGLFITLGTVGLCSHLATDNSDYMYLVSNQSNAQPNDPNAQNTELITKLKKVFGNKSKETQGEGTTSASSGAGVNLLLIAKMNDGYAKELLNLYKDLQEGKITTKDTNFVEVSTLLGMQVNETGTYDGTLAQSYLPYKNNKVVWKQSYKGLTPEQMTVRGFGDKEWQKLGGGRCSWLSEGADNPEDRTPWCMQGNNIFLAKSTINGVSNSGRKKAEQHYIPDNIASLNRRFNNFIKHYRVDSGSLTSEENSILAASVHNRGEGGVLQCAYGFGYNPDGEESSDKASKVLKNNNYNLGIALNNSASLLSSYMSNSKANLSSLTSSDKGRLIFAAIAAHSNNWFFSQDAYKYLSGHRNDFIDVWNKLYPSENVSSSKALAQVKSRISNLNTAIKNISGESLTSAQTKTVYETNSNYDDSKYNKKRGWGSVYCVVNKKIKYADGKNHTLVSCYDLVGGGYLVSACMMGKYVYAKMLKVSGVGIDPTNPATYLNNLAKSGTYVPGGSNSSSNNGSSSTNSKVNTWLSQLGLESNSLTPKQVSLMEGIYGRLGTPYKACRHSKGCDGYCYDSNNPSHLDAATFIWRSFYDADMKINALSCRDLVKDGHFSRVAWKARKPGDVLVTFGEKKAHAMFYLKDKGNTLTVAEATAGKESKVTDLARGTTIYANKSGSKNTVHYGKKGGKKYVLLRYNGITN